MEERRNGASVCYAYDKAGNRIRKTDAKGATQYRFNRKNQLTEAENYESKIQFTCDRQGGIVKEDNLTGVRLFSYNSRHQQTKVETESGNVQENRYDAENLRFELLENGKRTGFVYHNGELLHEEGGIEEQISYHLGAGIDTFQKGQKIGYYHQDEQLSTTFITDWHGAVRNRYQYDAFGAELEATEQVSNRIRYTGQQYDELTGQYYLRARYYNPVLGRFMQEDVYQGDGLNLYAYCHNNPVVYYDPSGYMTCPEEEINSGIIPEEEKVRMIEFPGDYDVVHPGTVTPDNPNGIYTIRATGDYFDDRRLLADAAGISIPDSSEWKAHHIDYDPITNTMRMQFVSTDYHSYSHFGGAGAFKRYTGFDYGSAEAVEWAKNKNIQYFIELIKGLLK